VALMGHQQPVQDSSESPVEQEQLPSFITDCHRNAIESMGTAFAGARPLAILVGDGNSGAAFVIKNFLSGLSDDVVVARISTPSSNAIELMREIVAAIGFDPKEMSLTDLEQVFEMFLRFQQTHNRRTIICVEQAQDHGKWVLDRISRLVESETKRKFGLMVILSGRPVLNEMLAEPPLSNICAGARKRISLAPFTVAETKEYIRRRVEGTGAAGVDQLFSYNAIGAVQELSLGVPDKVNDLCSKCLELADLEGTAPVTTALVNRAAKLLRLESMVEDTKAVVEEFTPIDDNASNGRLTVYVKDFFDQDLTLDGGHVLIGRDRHCDLCIRSKSISRHHALIVQSTLGVKLLDLGSKNGTHVNGHRIKRHTLLNSDKITIGDCSIEFIAGDDQQSWFFADEPTETFDTHMFDVGQPGNGNGQAMPSVDATRTMISPRSKTARS